MNYAVINTTDLSKVDFNEITDTNEDTLRFSVDGNKFVVEYGETPNFFSLITLVWQGSESDCFDLMQTSEWTK